MGLTGGVLAWLVVLLTVAVFGLVVWAWPTVAGRSVWRVAARVGMLLGVNLLVLLTVAIQLNDQFLFFADWTDLRGALGGVTETSAVHSGGGTQQAAAAPVQGPAASRAPGELQPLPAGSRVQEGVTSYSVSGPLSKITGQIVIGVPSGYDPKADVAYPVLETFSGYPSSATQWVKTMRLQGVLAEQGAAHRIHPTVVVSPQVEVPAGVDTECVNGAPGSPQLETWLTEDVPNWVAAHFRVSTERGSWATIGLSAGGWCAAMAAMLHPAQYGAAVVMGGYFHPLFGPAYEPYPPNHPLAKRYDLVALAKRSPEPLALWVETSHADPVSYTSSAALLKAARSPLSVSATILQNAGHRIGVWQNLLPGALGWLGQNVPGFRP